MWPFVFNLSLMTPSLNGDVLIVKALHIEQLTKVYPKGVQALSGIDLRVEQGDFFALLGPNGAGKSTAIGVVCSLLNKTSGKVRIFGHDLDTEREAAKACIGLAPQEFNFNMFDPVVEILTNQAGYYGIPHAEAAERAEKLLRQLHLWGKRRVQARLLSGGMKRRLMIARALVHHPRLLILDEPTAGVDIEIRHSMWAFLREINQQGVTIILTTHYLEEAENLCRNIAIISQGRIVEQTQVHELLRRLHQEVFVIDTAQALDKMPSIEGFKLDKVAGHRMEVSVSREHGLSQLFAGLNAAGVEVVSLRNKQNRLEQLFMDVVNHSRGTGV